MDVKKFVKEYFPMIVFFLLLMLYLFSSKQAGIKTGQRLYSYTDYCNVLYDELNNPAFTIKSVWWTDLSKPMVIDTKDYVREFRGSILFPSTAEDYVVNIKICNDYNCYYYLGRNFGFGPFSSVVDCKDKCTKYGYTTKPEAQPCVEQLTNYDCDVICSYLSDIYLPAENLPVSDSYTVQIVGWYRYVEGKGWEKISAPFSKALVVYSYYTIGDIYKAPCPTKEKYVRKWGGITGYDKTMDSCCNDPLYQDYNCPVCGNKKCEAGETVDTCPQDCEGYCGDGICNSYFESSETCPQDCPIETVCGDGVCSPYESIESCPEDCPGICGDGICNEYYEDYKTCPEDCPFVPTGEMVRLPNWFYAVLIGGVMASVIVIFYLIKIRKR